MPISYSTLTLISVLTLALFLCILSFLLWYSRREDKTLLWLAAWLAATAVFAICRLLQYAALEQPVYTVVPRILLTAIYLLTWIGNEFTNALVGKRPARRERTAILSVIGALTIILWTTPLILTRTGEMRTVLGGGSYHGVVVGALYLPTSLIVLLISFLPVIRLLRTSGRDRQESVMMAVGFLLIILFSLNDFIAVTFNLIWLRLSDYSYIPMAVLFTFIQIRRFSLVYRNLDGIVQERTAELSQANESLRLEIIEREKTEEKVNHHAVEMTALYETTHDLVIEHGLSKLLHTIVERAVGLMGASGGGLYLCDPQKREVRCVVSLNTPQDYTGVILKYGEGSAGLVAQTGEPLLVDDYRAWPGRAAVYESDQPFVSILSVPMRWQDQMLGIIHVLDSTRPFAFNRDDIQVLALFANQAAIAIENSRLFGLEQDHHQEAAAIAEVGRDISSSLQLDVVLERIATHAKRLLRADTSAVYLAKSSAATLQAVAAIGPDSVEIMQNPISIGKGILGSIAMQKVGEIINDSYTDPRALVIQGTEINPLEHLMGVPVLSKDELSGLIAVWRTGKENAFKPTDLEFLTSLAGQVGVAIENARLFEEEQTRRQEADTLREAAQRITSSLNQDQAIQMIFEQMAKVVPFESASVQLLRDGYLEVVGGQGWTDRSVVLGLQFPVPGNNPNSKVILDRRPVILGNAPEESTGFLHPPHERVRSWLGVPMIVRGRVIGMISVDHSQPDYFTQANVQFVSALAGQAAIAIENAHLYEETQKRLREMEGIAQVSAILARTLELEPLLENVLQSVIRTIPAAKRGSILLTGDDQNLYIRAIWGYSDPRIRTCFFPLNSGYASIAFCERRGIIVPDVRANPRVRYDGDIPEMGMPGSAIAAPLIIKDHAIGVIAIDTPLREKVFSQDDLHLLEAVASPAALAIENARLFEYTQRRLAELEIIQTIAAELRVAQTLEEALPVMLDRLINLLQVGSALLEIFYPASGQIVTELARGIWAPITGMRTPANMGVSGRVISTGQPYISTDVISDGLMVRPDLVEGLNSVACVPVSAQHQPIGTLWVGRSSQAPFSKEEINLLTALGEMLGNTIQRMKLHEQTERQAEEIMSAYDLTLEGWAKALELRDKETEGHSRRVTEFTLQLARKMGIPEAEMIHIRRGVLLHDIGKLGVPDQLLKKPGPLSDEDWIGMKKHTQYAYDLIYPISYLRPALDIPYYHHEHWDGSGYPLGLSGEQIPLPARIFAIVDVYDALSSDRPYRLAWSRQAVINYLKDQSGKLFDPRIVDAFLQLLDENGIY